VFKRLFSVLSGDYPLEKAARRFTKMLELSREMIIEADAVYWGKQMTPEERTALYEKDVEVNRLQRTVRKAVITHLSSSASSDVPYGLLLMSLVKDVERLGDYAKNITEIPKMVRPEGGTRELPDDELVAELREITQRVIATARNAVEIYNESNNDRAKELTLEGRSIAKRCDQLVTKIAQSDYSASVAVDLTLAARFYKRLLGHLLNLLSSLLMPLHKLDYYDENAIPND